MKTALTGWRALLATARQRANLGTERTPLWRLRDWGLKLISRQGVVPFTDLVEKGFYIDDPDVVEAFRRATLTIFPSKGEAYAATVTDLIRDGKIHVLEIESVARVAGGFFSILGALVRRPDQSQEAAREAKFGWEQVFIQTLPDDAEQPGFIGLVVDLRDNHVNVLVEARFEATADHAEGQVVLNATYAASWSNLHGAHGLPGDHMVRRFLALPTLVEGPGYGDGGRERKVNRLTIQEWKEGALEVPADRYCWMNIHDLLRAQRQGLTSPHLDIMLGRLLPTLLAARNVATPST